MATSRLHHGYFYEDDQELTKRLTKIVLESLKEDRLVLLFLTKEHKASLEQSLGRNNVNVREESVSGRLKLLDAVSLKQRLVENGMVDQERFNATFASLLREGAEAGKEITVCGEIVNLLWNEGNSTAALTLERLWDDILAKHNLHIHCAYAAPKSQLERSAFKSVDDFHARHTA